MSLKKYALGLTCLLLAFTLITGCTKGSDSASSQQSSEKKIKIGFSMDTLVQERWLQDRDIFVARANELGAEVIVQSANSDSTEQARQVEYLIDQGINVLVIIPHDAEKAASLVREAQSKGIKVICYDRLIKNAGSDLYVSFDNIKVGELMAESITQKVPAGNYLIINGSKLDNNSYMFNEGYFNILRKYISNDKIRVVDQTWANDWRYEEAFKFIEKHLNNGTKIDAVICGNDTLAGAAVDALAEVRSAGKIPVVGHDADLDGCQRVVEGTQIATIYKPIEKLAKAAAEYAVQLANKQDVQVADIIDDGKSIVKYFKIDPILVTNENMYQAVIGDGDGFHKLEDVYRNVPREKWPIRK